MDLGRSGNLILLFDETYRACWYIFSVENVHLKWENKVSWDCSTLTFFLRQCNQHRHADSNQGSQTLSEKLFLHTAHPLPPPRSTLFSKSVFGDRHTWPMSTWEVLGNTWIVPRVRWGSSYVSTCTTGGWESVLHDRAEANKPGTPESL